MPKINMIILQLFFGPQTISTINVNPGRDGAIKTPIVGTPSILAVGARRGKSHT